MSWPSKTPTSLKISLNGPKNIGLIFGRMSKILQILIAVRCILKIEYKKAQTKKTWRPKRRVFTSLCVKERLSIRLVSLKDYAWVNGSQERNLGLWLGYTSPTHISILFLKYDLSFLYTPALTRSRPGLWETTINQNEEYKAERGQAQAGVGLNSLSRSLYGFLEPRDACMRATCQLAFTVLANEGVVLDILLTSVWFKFCLSQAVSAFHFSDTKTQFLTHLFAPCARYTVGMIETIK
jgi:hypothetical protein